MYTYLYAHHITYGCMYVCMFIYIHTHISNIAAHHIRYVRMYVYLTNKCTYTCAWAGPPRGPHLRVPSSSLTKYLTAIFRCKLPWSVQVDSVHRGTDVGQRRIRGEGLVSVPWRLEYIHEHVADIWQEGWNLSCFRIWPLLYQHGILLL